MCFHIFARNKTMTVVYASESIELLPGGKSSILIDMIIRNTSESDIDEIELLYPRAFVHLKKDRKDVPVFATACNDLTGTIVDDYHAYNGSYNVGNYKFTHGKESGTDKHDLEFWLPDFDTPYNNSQDSPIKCTNRGIDSYGASLNDFSISSMYSSSSVPDALIGILEEINFTVLKYKFKSNFKPNECTFLRLKIGPYTSAICGHSIIKDYLKSCLSTLFFPYEIVSPYDVLHRFISHVHLHRKNPNLDIREDMALKELVGVIDVLKKSHTSYDRWLLNIHPSRFGLLHNFVLVGNVHPLGVLPNNHDELLPIYYPVIRGPRLSILDKLKNIWTKVRLNLAYYKFSKLRAYNFITTSRLEGWENIESLDRIHGFRLYFSSRPAAYLTKLARGFAFFVIFYVAIIRELVNMALPHIATWGGKAAAISAFAHESPVVFHLLFAPCIGVVEHLLKSIFFAIWKGRN